MACQMRGCGQHHGGIHFRLASFNKIMIDMYAMKTGFILRDVKRDETIALGSNDAILNAVYEGDVPNVALADEAMPANMDFDPVKRLWSVITRTEENPAKNPFVLFKIAPCVLAAQEMHLTKRPGKPGFTSVILDGVPIKQTYEYTGAVLATTGGQP